jgi:hypothetical protein
MSRVWVLGLTIKGTDTVMDLRAEFSREEVWQACLARGWRFDRQRRNWRGTLNLSRPSADAAIRAITVVAAGARRRLSADLHAEVLLKQAPMYCWSYDFYGELGDDNADAGSDVPVLAGTQAPAAHDPPGCPSPTRTTGQQPPSLEPGRRKQRPLPITVTPPASPAPARRRAGSSPHAGRCREPAGR